jgi:hypothetical protein
VSPPPAALSPSSSAVRDGAACVAATVCRATFCAEDGAFHTCRATAPSGPVSGGGCAGLDAQACSRHDDCAALYARAGRGGRVFVRCVDELMPRASAVRLVRPPVVRGSGAPSASAR